MSEAPYPEAEGYNASPGFVKNNPLNNDFYVERFKDDPWYPIIKSTHEEIKKIAPGYNINQIKSKFGGLRYYVGFPEGSVTVGEYSYNNTVEKQIARAKDLIRYAEAWVDGFEFARGNNANLSDWLTDHIKDIRIEQIKKDALIADDSISPDTKDGTDRIERNLATRIGSLIRGQIKEVQNG